MNTSVLISGATSLLLMWYCFIFTGANLWVHIVLQFITLCVQLQWIHHTQSGSRWDYERAKHWKQQSLKKTLWHIARILQYLIIIYFCVLNFNVKSVHACINKNKKKEEKKEIFLYGAALWDNLINILFQGYFVLCLPNYYFPQTSVLMLKNIVQQNWLQFVTRIKQP